MEQPNARNLIIAFLLAAVVLFGWEAGVRYFYPNANKPQPVAATVTNPAAVTTPGAAAETPVKHTRDGGLTSAAELAVEARDLKTALASPDRVQIAAPGLSGSINLVGGAIDDLVTNRHTATVDKGSGAQRIFSPAGTPAQQFAQFGWAGQGTAVPTPTTRWAAPAGARLTPQTPVTLTASNGAGTDFELTYAIDSDYMITATQRVINRGTGAITVQPVAQLNRTDKTASLDSYNVHSGPVGSFDGSVSFGPNYSDVLGARTVNNPGRTDWVGFTDIYWMSTLIPDAARSTSDFRSLGKNIYLANLLYDPVNVGAGQQFSRTTRLFAGAKESAVLDRYEQAGVPHFSLAIDWGWFRWFEKPILWLLKSLFDLVGNFGVAIILLTVIVRGIMFPIAQKQFASMAAMKAIQPKMKAIQERYKDDKPKQQEEIMALYKKEGVNPLAGCLPILLQIPVFFALYKVLILAVEMRHQPFVLWIKDLSAPDPLNVAALAHSAGMTWFPAFLGIGVLALLLGVTMWLQFKLNPAAMDPIQQQMFTNIMPWIMMFVMAPFAAGLLLYWVTSNVLTIAQQKYLYARHPELAAQDEKVAADSKRAAARGK